MACAHASECACCGMLMVFWAPLVFRVPSGPAAREIATREPTARSGRSRSPPWPSGPSGTLHTGGACVAVCGWARRLEARPGPTAWVPPPGYPASLPSGARWQMRIGASARSAPVPSVPSGTLHTGGACVAVCGWVRRLEARPGPAPPTGTAAHGVHSLAQQVLRCPPYWSCKPPSGAVRSRFEVVSCPKCRPPRRKTLKTGCYGRSGLRFGHVGTCHSALLAREPAIASGNPLCRT